MEHKSVRAVRGEVVKGRAIVMATFREIDAELARIAEKYEGNRTGNALQKVRAELERLRLVHVPLWERVVNDSPEI